MSHIPRLILSSNSIFPLEFSSLDNVELLMFFLNFSKIKLLYFINSWSFRFISKNSTARRVLSVYFFSDNKYAFKLGISYIVFL